MFNTIYRRGLLSATDFPPLRSFLKRHGWRFGVDRFVAGERLEDATKAIRKLESRSLLSILDLLGEFVTTAESVEAMTQEILLTLEVLSRSGIAPYLSIKPTQIGLAVDPDLAWENAQRILDRGRAVGAHICLDMESHPYLAPTLDLYRRLHKVYGSRVSTVLQSYIKGSLADLDDLLGLDPKPVLRIVKGAYKEDPEIVYRDKNRVDRSFRELTFRGLERGATINVATHDERLLAEVAAFVRGAGIPHDRYEFQLLYGVKPKLQEAFVRDGHPVRIYVPYGKDWYGYFSRRLAERPANLMFVIRGLFG